MEILFWILAAAMGAAAAAVVAVPLWRRAARDASRRQANVAIYRERVAELREEASAQRIPAAQADAMEAELGRRLLAEAAGAESPPTSRSPRRPWGLTLALVLVVPALALALYWWGGNRQLVGGPPSLPYLVERLEERVLAVPTDTQAWLMLGEGRQALGRYRAAAAAYHRVNALLPAPRADALVREAQALARATGGLAGRPLQLFLAALEIEPEHGAALWYAGLAAAQAQEVEKARSYWRRLAAKEGLPEQFRAMLERSIAQLGSGAETGS